MQGSQEGTWMDKTGEDRNGLNLGIFEERRPTVFQITSVYIKMSFTKLEIILSCYVAVILKMKDSCSANLTFRAHN